MSNLLNILKHGGMKNVAEIFLYIAPLGQKCIKEQKAVKPYELDQETKTTSYRSY